MAEDPPIIPLSRFAGLATRARGRDRLDALLSDRDPAARVAATPTLDLFYLIKEIGLADAVDLIALAAPEQVQGFIDLDAWEGDQLHDLAVRPWLAALVEAEPEQLAHVWRGLDQELTALLLARWTRIYNLAEQEVPDWEEPPLIPTPDRFFMVKVTKDDPETTRLVERLLDHLYRVDDVLARHTLRAAASEPTAELEEQSYRWRRGRLQDLGYADPEEAPAVYAPIDVASVKVGEASQDRPETATQLPALFSEPALRQPFLGRVLTQIVNADEARRLEAALVTLMNGVLSADRVPPGDPTAAAAGAARAAGTLSLGLETVARGELDKGVQALASVAVARLHRVGATLLLQLQKLARLLAPRGVHSDEPYASVLAAALERRPAFARALDEPPGVGARPLASLADLRAATHALAVLAAQVTIVYELLDADPAHFGTAATLGTLGRTAVVRAALGLPVAASPLAPAELQRYLAQPADPEQIINVFDNLSREQEIELGPEFRAVISGWIGDLRSDLARWNPSAPEGTRFLEGILLVGERAT